MGIFSSKPAVPSPLPKAPVAEIKRTVTLSAAPKERIITVKPEEESDELPIPASEPLSDSVRTPTVTIPVSVSSPLELKIAGLSVTIDKSKLVRAKEESGSEILKTMIDTVIVPESEESSEILVAEPVAEIIPSPETAPLPISEPIINQYKEILETAEESYGSSEFILSDTTIASMIVESVEEPVVESVEEPVVEPTEEPTEELHEVSGEDPTE